MLELRLCKTVIAGSLALFALLCGYGNIVDFETNYGFVQHVLSMDTTFPGNRLMGRAITDPVIWHAAYSAIIITELGVGVTFSAATWKMALALRGPATGFNRAKRLFYLGAVLAFLLWFTGFLAVAGEWFLMWQSASWNGQQAAFRFYSTILLALIFISREEPHDGDQ
jgi:predicted small integral membrane protein